MTERLPDIAEGLLDLIVADLHVDHFAAGDHRPYLQKIEDRFAGLPVEMHGKFDLDLSPHALLAHLQQFGENLGQRINGILQNRGEGHDLLPRQATIPNPVFFGNIGGRQHGHRQFAFGLLDVAQHQIGGVAMEAVGRHVECIKLSLTRLEHIVDGRELHQFLCPGWGKPQRFPTLHHRLADAESDMRYPLVGMHVHDRIKIPRLGDTRYRRVPEIAIPPAGQLLDYHRHRVLPAMGGDLGKSNRTFKPG
ncbi:MAG: hypothetical protein ACD_75C01425G0005 [uncultured bacterium]|nr:MAG: hypothetical protein ACD_75C01425G0005 [uncultured bacterium]